MATSPSSLESWAVGLVRASLLGCTGEFFDRRPGDGDVDQAVPETLQGQNQGRGELQAEVGNVGMG